MQEITCIYHVQKILITNFIMCNYFFPSCILTSAECVELSKTNKLYWLLTISMSRISRTELFITHTYNNFFSTFLKKSVQTRVKFYPIEYHVSLLTMFILSFLYMYEYNIFILKTLMLNGFWSIFTKRNNLTLVNILTLSKSSEARLFLHVYKT